MAKFKKYTGVIFDMDGVLLDSENIYLKSLQKCMESLIHKKISIDELSHVIGMNNLDITNYLLETYKPNVSFDKLTDLQSLYFNKEIDEEGIQEMDGLTHFLQYLKSISCKMAVASSSDMPWIQEVLNELNITAYFDFIVSGDDIEHSKPNPEIFNIAANRLDIDKCDIVVIEDSVHGIAAANKAKIDVVAYKGSSIKQDTSNATYEVNTFLDLAQLFKEQQ